MKTVFSAKHNVLLLGNDGVMRPMDEEHFDVLEIAADTWQVLTAGWYFYVVSGRDEGVCIGCGCGAGDVRAFAQELCGKTVRRVLNASTAFENTAMNGCFEEALMSAEAAQNRAAVPVSFQGISFDDSCKKTVIGPGMKIDLGERTLEVLSFPDTSAGSLAFLDAKNQILFAGEELADFKKELHTISVEEFVSQLTMLKERRSEIKMICADSGIFFGDYIDKYLWNAQRILEGKAPAAPMIPPYRRGPLPDEQGQKVYYAFGVRNCDEQPEASAEEMAYQLFSNYADSKIIYDTRRVRKG